MRRAGSEALKGSRFAAEEDFEWPSPRLAPLADANLSHQIAEHLAVLLCYGSL
jgi:hypothetical protein